MTCTTRKRKTGDRRALRQGRRFAWAWADTDEWIPTTFSTSGSVPLEPLTLEAIDRLRPLIENIRLIDNMIKLKVQQLTGIPAHLIGVAEFDNAANIIRFGLPPIVQYRSLCDKARPPK